MRKVAKKKAPRKVARRKADRKKAAKKRTTRRAPRKPARRPKVARKKPRKKPVHKKPKPTVKKSKKHTVTLSEPYGPDFNPHLRVSHKDKVRWYNDTPDDRTLTFGVQIFTKATTTITVLAYQHSDWYTISKTTVAPRSYGYGIDPSFDITGLPDPPQVSADA